MVGQSLTWAVAVAIVTLWLPFRPDAAFAQSDKPDSSWVSENIHLVLIPAGSFEMGTEDTDDDWFMQSRPIREVYVDSFLIGTTEISQSIFQKVLGFNPSLMAGDEYRPVDQVSWYDAVEFCNRLSEIAGLNPSYDINNRSCIFTRNGYRLPTEAEWEYACRAGTTTRYYSGNSESDLARVGWYRLNSDGTTHPAAQKEPNAWGLFDMHGNVWEWCNDWMGNYRRLGTRNPTGPRYGHSRVLRGGGWHYPAVGCHVAYRHRARPEFKISAVGFRLARNLRGEGLRTRENRKPGYPYTEQN